MTRTQQRETDVLSVRTSLFLLVAAFAVGSEQAGAASLPDTTFNIHPWIQPTTWTCGGGARSYSQSELDFIADHYRIASSDLPCSQVDSLKSRTPGLVYLQFKQTFSNYDSLVDKTVEFSFLHTADPASLIAYSTQSAAVALDWRRDSRTNAFNTSGYNVYRSQNLGGPYTLQAALSANATNFVDNELTDGTTYYYYVTMSGAGPSGLDPGPEYDYSTVVSAVPSPVAPSSVLTQPEVIGISSTSTSLTLRFRVTHMGSTVPAGVFLRADLNANHAFDDSGEVFMLSSIGGGRYEATVTISIPLKDAGGNTRNGGFAYHLIALDSGSGVLAKTATYTTNPNNSVKMAVYGGPFAMDVGSADYRQWYVNGVNASCSARDGVHSDIALDSLVSETPVDALPFGYSDTAWRSAVGGLFQSVKTQFPTGLVTYNGWGGVTPANRGWLSAADGGMFEGYAHNFFGDKTSGSYTDVTGLNGWTDMNQAILDNEAAGKASLILTQGQVGDAQTRLYSLASYLLVKGSRTYFYYNTTDGCAYTDIIYFPEWNIPIGSPTQSYANLANYFNASDQVYERRYSNGLVLVNPSSTQTSPSISVSASYQVVQIQGDVIAGIPGSPYAGNGQMSLTTVGSVQLPPHTGVVLLGAGNFVPPAKPRGLRIH